MQRDRVGDGHCNGRAVGEPLARPQLAERLDVRLWRRDHLMNRTIQTDAKGGENDHDRHASQIWMQFRAFTTPITTAITSSHHPSRTNL